MKSVLVFSICIMFASLASVNAECLDYGVEARWSYILEGQPGFVHCPLKVDPLSYNVTWSENGSTVHVTAERQSRIYRDGSMLRFVPARLGDSGYYSCVVWNSTGCFKRRVKVIVFKNHEGLCYNTTARFSSIESAKADVKVVCADLTDYVDGNTEQIQWYKECEPVKFGSSKFVAVGINLIIHNVTKADAGNYTCELPYNYDGKPFNLSRTKEVIVKVIKEQKLPVIIYPKNDSVEAELGSQVNLACNVAYSGKGGNIAFWWSINDMFAEDYDRNRVLTDEPFPTTSEDGTSLITRYLNISEVKKEDYETKFVCNLQTGIGATKYVLLKRPVPNFQGSLIAIFVALALVIVITILTYKLFKIDIVLWHRQNFLYRTSKEDGKIYDAYVMFPKSRNKESVYPTDTFVLKVLPEVLERQCGYKLFIFGRDELPGEAIADVIDETMNQSRRLIIVVTGIQSSDDFFEDAFEQQIALYDALVSNKVKAILIELEKIVDYTNMPESIKYIKQKQGVIKWRGEFTDRSLLPNTRFWKNVRYRMPPAQRFSSRRLDFQVGTFSTPHIIKVT
ncbi:interleukin-1 receptor type 1-like isoform X2 [Rhinatrema bivittatum]|uniref:interleukin-1 receptor type 1-like isoform X2 n=1 Tax=Rhinatrema bivittatum TaxID=194408 RepID=UPI0011280F14|nr:interleukin-1 receptor type 1-like isoform X2 [Rhinatrema bivittatum]XP_029460684.1 interleukin-1 receptor type 1-like isoform X2 [Rhinatrema bivittatum]XP_029460685.1 interleukin-1 receptor type 1-like isoform X2 [Rhinatrema bivittatum]XP_029460686.1 interleukin-1 receptor type 1-like isoform X2 [Rhinatrema bivittatum]